MRSREFLPEAGLKPSDFVFKNNHYWKNLLNLIKQNSEIELVDGSAQRVTKYKAVYRDLANIWDGEELATPDQIEQIKMYKIPFENGMTVPVTKIQKTDYIKKGSGADLNQEEGLVKFWNIGNVVECVMGAAVTAKFLQPEKTIEWKDIVNILRRMAPGEQTIDSKGKVSKLVPYSMSTMARNDKLSFIMSLNSTDFRALEMSYKDANTLQKIPQHEEIFKAYTDAAEYVNTSNTVSTAVDRVIQDVRANQVIIESEGASHEKQTSTKADLFITIDGTRERLLSLKAKKVPQVGQVSGHAFSNLEEFFKSTLGFGLPKSMSKNFPLGPYKTVGPKIWSTAFPMAYKHMFKALSSTLQGNSDYKEYDFVKQIYEAVRHHATLGEDVIIVYLSPSAKKSYTELKIGQELFNALKNFDLYPVMAGPTKIRIIGRPITPEGQRVTGGKDLDFVQLRSFEQKGTTIRNVVEIQALFKALADLENLEKREIPVQPVPQKPKTTPKTTPQTTPTATATTPGIANKNATLAASKIPMGQQPR